MPFIRVIDARISDLPALAAAIVPTYSRVEPLPYDADFGRSLAAPVADPLWLLGRQWQMREFQGEDAGTPISVRLTGESGKINRFLAGTPQAGVDPATVAADYDADGLPLEAIIEREPARAVHPRLAAEAGLHFLRLLRADPATAGLASLFRAAYPLTIESPRHADVDTPGRQWNLLARGGRGLDGATLAAALRPLLDAAGKLTALPPAPVLPAGVEAACLAVLERWIAGQDAGVTEPNFSNTVDAIAAPSSAWNPSRQEYSLAAQATVGGAPVVLVADEYTGQRLDWYSFNAADRANPGQPGPPTTLGGTAPAGEPLPTLPTLPVPLSYPGMPARRFWELEDSAVSLPKLDAGVGDLARMLMVEFALVYGNDWYVIPLDVPVGSLTRIDSFVVSDTFGFNTFIRPAREMPSAGGRWEMFALAPAAGAPQALSNLLFVPPTVPLGISGSPVEEVALFRDELANMAWGVEHRVQGTAGDSYARRDTRRPAARPQMDPLPDDVSLVYRLMTPVPEHWIPFVPVPADAPGGLANFAIQLEQRALIRQTETPATPEWVDGRPPFEAPLPPIETGADAGAGDDLRILPLGQLLRAASAIAGGPSTLRLEEEEVPRDGVLVRRAFEFCRWHGGRRVTWLGRSKQVGRGEGSSGLRFDAADRRT